MKCNYILIDHIIIRDICMLRIYKLYTVIIIIMHLCINTDNTNELGT